LNEVAAKPIFGDTARRFRSVNDIFTAMGSAINAPIIILASPRSYTSVVCAMIGQHPGAYGLPEVNLFAHKKLGDFAEYATLQRQFLLHGLLRAVAELYSGEQTPETIAMANRWIKARIERTCGEIYRELAEKIAPLRLADKSPVYSKRPEALARIEAEFPDTQYLYLIRNPIDQGDSMLRAQQGFTELLANRSLDFSFNPPRVEPQYEWYKTQTRILHFLKQIPEKRKCVLRGEEFTGEPEKNLKAICGWLGLEWSAEIGSQMMHPENSPYACVGPFGAHSGNNPGFQRSPHFRASDRQPGALDRPLPWREDGFGLKPEVSELARSFGYV